MQSMNNIKCGVFSLDVSINYEYFNSQVGRDSSVGIATRYGLDGQGIESRWEARFSSSIQTGRGAHPTS